MYPTTGSTLRADINAIVEEAQAAEQFFIGMRSVPPLPVSAKSGQYPKVQIAAGGLADDLASTRDATGVYNRVTRQWTYDTYDCQDRGIEEVVDDSVQSDLSRFFNYEASAARWCLRNITMAHEIRAAAAVMNATNFGAGTASSVAYTVANIATIDFPLDVLAACARVKDNLVQPNTIIMSDTVYHRLAQSTLLKAWVRGTAVGQAQVPINGGSIAASFRDFGITQCLIGGARYNAAKKGQAKSMTAVWGTTYVWVGYVNPGANIAQDGGALFTLYWNQEGGLFVSETYRSEERRSNIVRVRQNTAEKCVDGTAGTLITTQWA